MRIMCLFVIGLLFGHAPAFADSEAAFSGSGARSLRRELPFVGPTPLRLAQGGSSQRNAAYALLSEGIELGMKSRWEQSVRAYEAALAIYRRLGDAKEEAITISNLTGAYLELNRFDAALRVGEPALALSRRLGDREGEQLLLFRLGVAEYRLGRHARAIVQLRAAAELARKLDDSNGRLQALGTLGYAYEGAGDYQQALASLRQAFVVAQANRNVDAQITALEAMARLYRRVEFSGGAAAMLSWALDLARTSRTPAVKGLLMNLGAAEYKSGRLAAARIYFEAGLDLANREQDAAAIGEFSGNLALVELGSGNLERADQLARADLAMARQRQETASTAEALAILGDVSLSRKDPEGALRWFRQSADLQQGGTDPRRLKLLMMKIGGIQLAQGRPREAETSLRQAIVLGKEERRLVSRDDILNTASFDFVEPAYTDLQAALIAQDQGQQALLVAEAGRAQAFADLLRRRKGSTPAAEGLDLAGIQAVARRNGATIVEYSIRPARRADVAVTGPRSDELFIWVIPPRGEITVRRVSLESPSPTPTATAPDLAGLVSRMRCFGEGECLRREGTRSRSAQRRSRGTRPVTATPAAPAADSVEARLVADLRSLHDLLIAPIASDLPADPMAEVVIVPDDVLFEVPFAALLDPTNRHLIERHTLLMAPSVQILDLVQERASRRGANSGGSLLVGNPTMPRLPAVEGEPPHELEPLLGAEEEVTAIATLLGGQPLIGAAATKKAVLAKIAKARWIHLATHGLLFNSNLITGLPGALVLAPDPDLKGEALRNDSYGMLTANELLDLDLKADLFVMSACDTGLGRLSGDGVAGLSRAVLAAGATSTVITLWKVPDSPSQQLMVAFYRGMVEGKLSRAQALRQAMLLTMKENPSPIDWAAFTLVGSSR